MWPLLVELASWQRWIHRLGSFGLILLGILDSSVVPLPGSMDALTVVLCASNRDWWPFYVVLATAGSVLGGYLTYRVASRGEKTLEKKIGKKRAEKAFKKFERRGFVTIFVGCILPPPFPLVPILMAAGALQYPTRKFISAIAAGRFLRYAIIGYVAHRYGEGIINFFSQYQQPILYALIALGILGGITALTYFLWYRPRRRRQERARGERVEDFPLPGQANQAELARKRSAKAERNTG